MTTSKLTGLQTRDFSTRAEVSEDGRTITAIGVPYDTRTEIYPGFFEEFAPGSVDDDGAILRYGHREPIGKITQARETDGGREITAHISSTQRGDEVVTLLADEVLTRVSIGFRFDEYEETKLDDGSILVRHTKARAHEYSVVEFPAYDDAKITDVRHTTTERENPVSDSTVKAEDLTALRNQVADLERALALVAHKEPDPPAVDTRSIGEVLKALAQRDEATLSAIAPLMAREYDGGTLSDDGALTPVWIKDLTRIINDANPLASYFSTGTLPATGMTLEYTELKDNTLQVSKQEKEGDALPKGKISVQTKTAAIETFGGANTMSFQEIQRAQTNMVTLTTKGMAIAAAKDAAASFHKFYEETAKASEVEVSISKALDSLKWADLLAMAVDASYIYRQLGLPLSGAIVNRETFLALGSMTGNDGRPLMQVTGTGSNTVGSVDARNLKGELSGLTFIPDFESTLDYAGNFYTAEALRVYTSGIGHLQKENVLDLTRDMSIYYYAANAAEIPSGLVQLKIGTGA